MTIIVFELCYLGGDVMNIDDLDRQILQYLQDDGRMSFVTLASELNVSEGTIRKRVRRLEENNIVQIVGVTDPFKIGLDTVAFIWLKIERGKLDSVIEELSKLIHVRYLVVTTGKDDVVAMVVMPNRKKLIAFLRKTVAGISGILSSETSIVLEIYKQLYNWSPFNDQPESQQMLPDKELATISTNKPDDDLLGGSNLNYELDDVDRGIIRLLQDDGRAPFLTIANELGLVEGTIRRRVTRLIESETLQIVGVTDPLKVGMHTVAIVGLKVERGHLDSVIGALKDMYEVRYVGLATGSYDVIIEVVVSNNDALLRFLIYELGNIDGIVNTGTSLVLKTSKQNYSWGLDD